MGNFQKAIDFIRTLKDNTPKTLLTEQERECYALAIHALGKRIQKKPKDVNRDYGHYTCPCCEELIGVNDSFEEHRYCLWCGQAIDWKEE